MQDGVILTWVMYLTYKHKQSLKNKYLMKRDKKSSHKVMDFNEPNK